MSCFTDQKQFAVTQERLDSFRRIKKRFNCKLCGKEFEVGDSARWIYANFKNSPVRCGNFFVCGSCDGENTDVLNRAAESFAMAVKLSKQWDIYGPEWQQDIQQSMR